MYFLFFYFSFLFLSSSRCLCCWTWIFYPRLFLPLWTLTPLSFTQSVSTSRSSAACFMNIYETDDGNINKREPNVPNWAIWDVAPEVHGNFLKTNLKKKPTEKNQLDKFPTRHVITRRCPQCEVSVCLAALRHAGLSASSGRQTDNRLGWTLFWLARQGGAGTPSGSREDRKIRERRRECVPLFFSVSIDKQVKEKVKLTDRQLRCRICLQTLESKTQSTENLLENVWTLFTGKVN